MAMELEQLRLGQAVQEERMNTMRAETQAAVERVEASNARVVASITEADKRSAEREKARAEEWAAESKARAEREAQRVQEQAAQDKAQAKREAQRMREQAAQEKAQAQQRAAEAKAQAEQEAQRVQQRADDHKELTRTLWFIAATIVAILTMVITMVFGTLGLLMYNRQQPMIIYASPPPVTAPALQPQDDKAPNAPKAAPPLASQQAAP